MTNPNARILIVPKEQGATEDDTYFGSIGDATQKHVASLSGNERMLWEHVITTRDGNIFRAVPSFEHVIPDQLGLKAKDLESLRLLAQKMGMSEEWIKAAIDEEIERREESEDALDRGQTIPFEDHERFAGMTKYIDIPPTPRDKFIYLGNCNQEYYDEFPEGHPDASVINMVLAMLKKDVDDMNEKYADWVTMQINGTKARLYVRKVLSELAYEVCTESITDKWNPDIAKRRALQRIDAMWRIEYRNEVAEGLIKDSMFMLFKHKEVEWENMRARGVNVFPHVKALGKLLHDDFRDQMRKVHWERYFKMKRKFAPAVIYKGKDINRCGVFDLQVIFNISKPQAITIWHKRPFSNLAELYNKNYINRTSFAHSESLDKATSYIDKQLKDALQKKNRRAVSEVARKLVEAQRLHPDKLTADGWKSLWVYYRICRDEFNKAISVK